MKFSIAIFVILAAFSLRVNAGAESVIPCTEEWNQFVDLKLVSGDGQGHGPDLGSDEWKGVIEFKLGIRGQADLPARDSDDWCQLVDQLVRAR
jgi:hypothetical protein